MRARGPPDYWVHSILRCPLKAQRPCLATYAHSYGVKPRGSIQNQPLPGPPCVARVLAPTHYSLLTARYSPLTTHYSLLTTHYSLLTTHYSLLTAHYSYLLGGRRSRRGSRDYTEDSLKEAFERSPSSTSNPDPDPNPAPDPNPNLLLTVP